MLDPVHDLQVSNQALDPGARQSSEPVFVREAHQLMRHYLGFVRRHWPIFIALPLAAAATAVIVTVQQPRRYEATAKVMAIGDAPPATYLPFLQNHSVADQAIRSSKIADPVDGLTPAELQSAIRVEVIRNTNVVAVAVTLRDPEKASALANQIAMAGLDLARRTKNLGPAIAIRDLLRARADEARASLERAADRVVQHRKKTQIDVLRKSMDAIFDERGQLSEISHSIDEERSRLIRAQADLASLSRIDALRRTIDESTLVAEATRVAAAANSPDIRSVAGVQIRADEVNRVYDAVNRQIAAARVELADLQRHRDQLVKAAELTPDDAKKLSQVYAVEDELSRLELERTIRENAFSEAFNRYESARLNVSRYGELIVLDPALPPDRPLGRGTVRNALMGAVAGLVLALVVVIGRAG